MDEKERAEWHRKGYKVDENGRVYRYTDITGKKKTGNEWIGFLLLAFCIGLPWVGIPFTLVFFFAPEKSFIGRFRDKLMR